MKKNATYLCYPTDLKMTTKNVEYFFESVSYVNDLERIKPDDIILAPYIADFLNEKKYDTDSNDVYTKRITDASYLFETKFVDEVILLGDHISDEMMQIIHFALEYGIKIIPSSSETTYEFNRLLE